MQTDKFMAKANMRGSDEILLGTLLALGDGCQEGRLSKEQVRANKLNETAHNKLVLSYNDKISFGIVNSSKTKAHPKSDSR